MRPQLSWVFQRRGDSLNIETSQDALTTLIVSPSSLLSKESLKIVIVINSHKMSRSRRMKCHRLTEHGQGAALGVLAIWLMQDIQTPDSSWLYKPRQKASHISG